MNIFEKLYKILIGSEASNEENLMEAEVCPNCWGKQEYGDQFREIVKERNLDANSQKAFVEQFIETHLTGIKLKKNGDIMSCSSCKKGFKKVSSNAN